MVAAVAVVAVVMMMSRWQDYKKKSFRCDSIPAIRIPETIVSSNRPQYPSHEFCGVCWR